MTQNVIGKTGTYRRGENKFGAHFRDGETIRIDRVDRDGSFYAFSLAGQYNQYITADQFVAAGEVAPFKPAKVFKPGTQNAMLLAHLLEGRTITRIQADHLYRIASLTRRIRDLRDAGHHIVATTKVDPTGRNYVEYSLRTQKKAA